MPTPMPTDPSANSPLDRTNSGLGFISANSRAPPLPITGNAYCSHDTAPGGGAAEVGGGASSTAPWGIGGAGQLRPIVPDTRKRTLWRRAVSEASMTEGFCRITVVGPRRKVDLT